MPSNVSKNKEQKLTGRKKAAIFILSLGAKLGSLIMKHLKDNEVELISFEIVRLANVTPEEKQKVLKEFYEILAASRFILNGGIEYANEILEKSFGAEKAIDIINRFTSVSIHKPFEFIRKTDPQHLINLLQSEHPQTIALILSYLEPKKASEVLSQLPVEMQTNIAKRIATMNRTSPEVIREVESILERKLSTFDSEDITTVGGVGSVAEILNLADRTTERSIIETLEEEDPELAEEIKKRMFVFEDVVILDDRSIQKVLRKVDNADLVKALKSVDEEVKDKFFKNMSKRAASLIQEDIDFMGPIRVTDVEEAQQKIVTIIRKLEEEGEVVIVHSGQENVLI